ncbi:MAG: GIY-YIG nuclease family protein [Porticoccaceae bacterium]
MEIKLESIITIEDPSNYKVHFAVWNGTEEPLDVFIRDQEEWKWWNSWKGQKNDFSRKYIFSLIRYYPQPGKWLFGGIFEVLERNSDSYEVELLEPYNKFIGRLLVQHPGPGARGRAFYLENYYKDFVVSEILDKSYDGVAFCGYQNVEHSFLQIELLIKKQKADWKSALENMKGVYIIADKSNGKVYIGSAYGEYGIWSRWCCYVGTGHGFNDELIKIIETNGLEYARQNFQFSILEIWPMRTDDRTIIEREQYWKRVFFTREFGYNKN